MTMAERSSDGTAPAPGANANRMEYHGFHTRRITPCAYVLTGCFHMAMYGREFHTHAAAYLVVGRDASALIDTGHAKDGPRIEAFVRSVVGDALTYVLPTHEEYPHAGNLDALLSAFPAATAVGEVRNYHLYYPDHAGAGRFRQMPPGTALDLGDRTLTILPGIIHDLPATAWAYDSKDGLLFVSDGFGFSHHRDDQCTLTTDELPFLPSLDDTRMVLDLALYWSRFADNRKLVDELRRMLATYRVRMVCPAHGNVVTDVGALAELVKASLLANGIERTTTRDQGMPLAGLPKA